MCNESVEGLGVSWSALPPTTNEIAPPMSCCNRKLVATLCFSVP